MIKITLEDVFDFKQKAVLSILFSIPLLSFIALFVNAKTFDLSKICLLLFFAVLSIIFGLIIFIKIGLSIKNKKLYLSYFCLNIPILNKILDFENKIFFGIYNKNVIQKNSYLSSEGGDLSYKDLVYDFIILDKNKENKLKVLTLRSNLNVKKLINFINNNTELIYLEI